MLRNPDLWADEEWQEYMWGVDITREAVEAWDRKQSKLGFQEIR